MARNRYLIGGGLLWAVLWTFHTIAHGPYNPSPGTGRFLGHSSLFYGYFATFLASPLLIIGWLKQIQSIDLKRKGLIYTAGIIGIIGFFFLFLFGALGLLQLSNITSVPFIEDDWFIYVTGLFLLIIGLVLYSFGLFKVRNLTIWFRYTPLWMVMFPLLISYLRRPHSVLLEKGELVGYLLLEGVGLIFGIGWMILGCIKYKKTKVLQK